MEKIIMNIRVEYTQNNEKEIIIRCREEDEEVQQIKALLEFKFQKLSGSCDGQTYLFRPSEVYYFECVDNKIFAYLQDNVCSVTYSLEKIEKLLEYQEFFRCSKAMILNMNYIEKFKSEMGNRITASLANGEDVVISRHYAKMLRAYLKEGRADE